MGCINVPGILVNVLIGLQMRVFFKGWNKERERIFTLRCRKYSFVTISRTVEFLKSDKCSNREN
jgi:hypothetical protein